MDTPSRRRCVWANNAGKARTNDRYVPEALRALQTLHQLLTADLHTAHLRQNVHGPRGGHQCARFEQVTETGSSTVVEAG